MCVFSFDVIVVTGVSPCDVIVLTGVVPFDVIVVTGVLPSDVIVVTGVSPCDVIVVTEVLSFDVIVVTGVVPFDVTVVAIPDLFILTKKTFCRLGIFSGVKQSKFAVCSIVWFELHARWFDWCRTRSLTGDSFGGNPCRGNGGVWGERAGAVVC